MARTTPGFIVRSVVVRDYIPDTDNRNFWPAFAHDASAPLTGYRFLQKRVAELTLLKNGKASVGGVVFPCVSNEQELKALVDEGTTTFYMTADLEMPVIDKLHARFLAFQTWCDEYAQSHL